jgi:hypothetical protein
MGYGDDIMATARVAELYERLGGPIRVVGLDGGIRRSPVFEHNPKIAGRLTRPAGVLVDGPGCRPYIDYTAMRAEYGGVKCADRFFFIKGTTRPGELYFSAVEEPMLPGEPYVMIEPHTEDKWGNNKHWGFDRFQAVVDMMPHIRFVQPDYGKPLLDGVVSVPTSTFREGCRLLRGARGLVSSEGGLHHAAAALARPAVVIFGGFPDPEVTGYGTHINLVGDRPGCGSRRKCDHCTAAMASITPQQVADSLETIL